MQKGTNDEAGQQGDPAPATRAAAKVSWPLVALRLVFVTAACGLSLAVIQLPGMRPETSWVSWVVVVVGTLVVACAIVAIDLYVPNKRLDTISSVYFGVIVAMFLTNVLNAAFRPMLDAWKINAVFSQVASLGIALTLCYVCVSLLMQTRDDFRFIIPYVEFAKEIKGHKPYVLDTSVVIDGRIADVVETKVFDSQLIMPRFVLGELQGIADSSDKLRRSRGRRGLDILNRLRNNPGVELEMFDRNLPEFEGQPVDMKLVLLAKHLDGRIVTNDYNLNKVARLHGVEVVNLNDLSNALKPVFLPGESLEVYVVRAGEEPGQGVGYLDDGTMIVIENGRDQIHKTIKITVTSVLQTSAGRMIFGKFDGAARAG